MVGRSATTDPLDPNKQCPREADTAEVYESLSRKPLKS